MKTIIFNGKKIAYSDEGKGKTLVFLHGFTESGKIWKAFTKALEHDFRVIVIDLPGHGKSERLGEIHTMELQAEVVFQVLRVCKVKKCIIIGHSMGGYVTLAFAGKYPQMLKGFCLFHSHIFADSPVDRENRDRTIRLVEENKFSFVTQFIRGLFPEEVQEKFKKEIDQLIKRAGKMEKEGIIASIEGMKARFDQTLLLKTTGLPVLFILGQKDSKAPVTRFWEMISLPAHSESLILRETGHMGFIEERDLTLNAIRAFARKVMS
jgi:pimeloyl-ACP methyl ester carboxylesterase